MVSLVSPEYNLEEFCRRILGKNPLEAMEAASAEIACCHRNYRMTTEAEDFPEGSPRRVYCEDLQRLVFLLMNGSIPAGATPDFLFAVKPLLAQLLQKWKIGNLGQFLHFFPNERQVEVKWLAEVGEPLAVMVSRAEVDAADILPSLGVLQTLTASPETAKAFFERVDIAFDGYDHVNEELFEIPKVRDFVYKLDREFPYWLFFLSKQFLGLQCLLFCFLPPFLTDEGRERIFPERIEQLLTGRWIPAMNHVCEYAGFTEQQITELTERVMAYITEGRFPLDGSGPPA